MYQSKYFKYLKLFHFEATVNLRQKAYLFGKTRALHNRIYQMRSRHNLSQNATNAGCIRCIIGIFFEIEMEKSEKETNDQCNPL